MTTTPEERQQIPGSCPATGRSASVCTDQTHTACWDGHRESVALDMQIDADGFEYAPLEEQS